VTTIALTATNIALGGGELATDGAGAGTDTGNIALNGAVTLTGNTIFDTDDGGAGTDGSITFTGGVTSNPANQFGVIFELGGASLDLSATAFSDIDFRVRWDESRHQ
jgi:hypothetical protein